MCNSTPKRFGEKKNTSKELLANLQLVVASEVLQHGAVLGYTWLLINVVLIYSATICSVKSTEEVR